MHISALVHQIGSVSLGGSAGAFSPLIILSLGRYLALVLELPVKQEVTLAKAAAPADQHCSRNWSLAFLASSSSKTMRY